MAVTEVMEVLEARVAWGMGQVASELGLAE
jgi:hypothetical protein